MADVQIGDWSRERHVVRVEGLAEAREILQRLPHNIIRNAVTAAVRAGNRVVIMEARRQAPIGDTGRLAKSIRGSVKFDRHRGIVYGSVRPKNTKKERKTGKATYYGKFVIGGTRPHVIPKEGTDAMAIKGNVFARIEHPGAKANPFMDRAAHMAFDGAVAAFRKKYAERAEAETAKLRAEIQRIGERF